MKDYTHRYNSLRWCRMYSGQFQKCPKAAQCDDEPRFCEYCIPELHVLCNFVSCLHSIEHLDHEAYMRQIYAPPSRKPAGTFIHQMTAKDVLQYVPFAGMAWSRLLVQQIEPLWSTTILRKHINLIKQYVTCQSSDLVNLAESSFAKKV